MESIMGIEKLLDRHMAFWQRELVNGPLIRLSPYSPLQRESEIPLAGGRVARDGILLTPEAVDAKLIAEWQGLPSHPVQGDLFSSVAPFGLCWNEAILGCPIRISFGSVWAAPFIRDLEDIDRIRFDERNPWLLRLLELTRLLVEKARNRTFVTQTLLRGPVDMAAAAIGYERLCLELYRSPREMERLLSLCTEFFLETAKAHISLLPPLKGGIVSGFDIWAPGTSIRSQTDNSVLLSPSIYERHILPFDRRIIEASEFPIIHTHQPCMRHILPSLLEIPGLKAIQMSLDRPNGPAVSELIPLMREVQEGKALIVTGAITREELKLMLDSLEPESLCLNVSLWSEEERRKALVPLE
ncbi:MAG: uroporphyrinogen decarboxylase family protein [Candidatus Bathyarchaeia archaeon]